MVYFVYSNFGAHLELELVYKNLLPKNVIWKNLILEAPILSGSLFVEIVKTVSLSFFSSKVAEYLRHLLETWRPNRKTIQRFRIQLTQTVAVTVSHSLAVARNLVITAVTVAVAVVMGAKQHKQTSKTLNKVINSIRFFNLFPRLIGTAMLNNTPVCIR